MAQYANVSALRVLRKFHAPVDEFYVCGENLNTVDLLAFLSKGKQVFV